MAFKRDGDDPGLLDKLRKQRVAELFSIDIPEDEAFLMRNGRFACTVCFHRPVFDTVSMLAVHRGGKKHALNLARKEAEKEELAELMLKRQQEQYLRDGTAYLPDLSKSQKPLGFHPLLLSAPYDPRVKKSKKDVRKVRVNLSSEPPADSVASNSSEQSTVSVLSVDTTAENNLPGHNKRKAPELLSNSVFIPQTISQYKMAQKCEKREQFAVKPYLRTSVPYNSVNQQEIQQTASDLKVSAAQTRKEGSPLMQKSTGSDLRPSCQVSNLSSSTEQSKVYVHGKFHKKKKQTHVTPVSTVSSEKQAKAEKYLYLRGAGWKKDLSGNWVKDEDAEFDSDEGPPDLP